MIRLIESVKAWGQPHFESVLKAEIAALGPAQLPLQQGLTTSSHVVDKPPQVMLIASAERGEVLEVKVGLFYTGIIAGCSCADDPTPVEEQAEYCVVALTLDRKTGEGSVALLRE